MIVFNLLFRQSAIKTKHPLKRFLSVLIFQSLLLKVSDFNIASHISYIFKAKKMSEIQKCKKHILKVTLLLSVVSRK